MSEKSAAAHWANSVDNLLLFLFIFSCIVLGGHCGGCLNLTEIIHGSPQQLQRDEP